MSEKYSPDILYEDNHIIVVNKKAGELAQGDKTGDIPITENIKTYLKEKYNKPGAVFCGLPHRLDRPTSGALVLAKTSKALSRLNKMFLDKDVKKTYLAIVPLKDIPKEETLVHFLAKNEAQNKSKAYLTEQKFPTKKAVLHYKILSKIDNYQLLEIELETGRHHQIRCQLSAIGLPIKGDLKYGSPRSNDDGSISLHAYKIEFIHPVSKNPIKIKAAVPKEKIWQELTKNIAI